MLEAGAAAQRAAAIAAVEAELAGGVATLARQRCGREDLSHRVPGADVAGGVGARRLADRGLVHKHDITEVVCTQQAVVQARRFGGAAEVAQQRRCQHVLDQAGLARAADAGDADQPLQRNVHTDIAQVVLTHAFQHQARRVVAHHALEAKANLLASAQVRASQRVRVAKILGAAVKHDLPAFLTWPRPHVDHAVSGKHHRRVMLDNDQGVAGVAQALHRNNDAAHVAGVQADAGLVQHEQGVDQRGAQRRGEVDALHFAAAERAALAVQRQVAYAHIGQVAQAGANFVEQQG